MSSRDSIENFLDQKRFAFVGVSRKPSDFSRVVFREFRAKGWDPVPVHPEAAQIDGEPCYAHVKDIQPPVDSALLMTSAAVAPVVAAECIAAGMKRVWFFRASDRQAVDACQSSGIEVIAGECPLMFLPRPVWIHRCHAFIKRIRGTYPIWESRTS